MTANTETDLDEATVLHGRRALLRAAAASAVFGVGAWTVGPQAAVAAPVGSPLRLPDVPLVGGGRYGEAQARGKVLVLYWWATWCPFCAEQSPLVHELWLKHRARGLEVLAISIDKQEATVREYLAAKGYRYPVAMNTPTLASVLPKPKGLPVTWVRGREGTVVFAEAGQLFPEDIQAFETYL